MYSAHFQRGPLVFTTFLFYLTKCKIWSLTFCSCVMVLNNGQTSVSVGYCDVTNKWPLTFWIYNVITFSYRSYDCLVNRSEWYWPLVCLIATISSLIRLLCPSWAKQPIVPNLKEFPSKLCWDMFTRKEQPCGDLNLHHQNLISSFLSSSE